MAGEWRVLIADDEPAARRGVRQLLAAFPSFEVVGECRDGAETLASSVLIKCTGTNGTANATDITAKGLLVEAIR